MRTGPAAASLLLVFAWSCSETASDPPPTAHRPTTSASTLEVQFAGCQVAEGSCSGLPGTAITVWAAAAPRWRLEIAPPGGWEPPQQEISLDGQRYRLVVGSRGGDIRVSARRGEQHLSWSLTVAIAEEPGWLRENEELKTQKASFERQKELLESALGDYPRDEGLIRSQLGRVVNRQGDASRAEGELRRAIELHRRAGRVGDEVRDVLLLHHMHIQAGAFARAQALLDQLPSDSVLWPADARVLAFYMRALQAEKTVDPGRGAAYAEQARQLAERTGLNDLAITAAQILARQLRRLGEHRIASAIFDTLEARLQASSLGCEDHAATLNNIAWDRLLARDLGLAAQDPVPLLNRSRELRHRCGKQPPKPKWLYGLEINLALAAVQVGDSEAAREHLRLAGQMTGDMILSDRLWHAIVAARLALVEDRPERAHQHCDVFERLAGVAFSDEARLGVAAIRARAFLAQGQKQAATKTLAAAQDLLDRLTIGFAPEPSMTAFVALGEPATRLLIETLIAQDRNEEAFTTVLHSRARRYRALDTGRCLASLDAESRHAFDDALSRFRRDRENHNRALEELVKVPRDQWAATRARLESEAKDIKSTFEVAARKHLGACSPSPRPLTHHHRGLGELTLAIHPLRRGWAVLAADDQGVEARRIDGLHPDMEPETLARYLLTPFAERIDRADLLRLLPHGFLNEIDLHALPFAGDVLLASVPVVYGSALPARPRAERGQTRMLIVGDPRHDLPEAKREAAEAAALHRAAGMEVTLLLQGNATRSAFLDRLGSYERLHFAGHSEVTDLGESTLLLAGRDSVSSADLLLARGVPRHVVLLACGAATQEGPRSIAALFLIHGAQTVVASSRQLRDNDAARLASVFYQSIESGQSESEAVRRAQLVLREEQPDADWASIRIFSRQPVPS